MEQMYKRMSSNPSLDVKMMLIPWSCHANFLCTRVHTVKGVWDEQGRCKVEVDTAWCIKVVLAFSSAHIFSCQSLKRCAIFQVCCCQCALVTNSGFVAYCLYKRSGIFVGQGNGWSCQDSRWTQQANESF